LCDEFYVLDNSRLDKPFQRVLQVVDGVREDFVAPLPEWLDI